MSNYALRGFLMTFFIMFILTLRSCKSFLIGSSENYFALVISCIVIGTIFGLIGLVIGKYVKADQPPIENIIFKKYPLQIFGSLAVVFIGLYFYESWKPLLFDKDVKSELKNNLENLQGVWFWADNKNDEKWFISICLTNIEQSGYCVITKHKDTWGGEKEDIMLVDESNFRLKEGYDIYGDKAYVGVSSQTGKTLFLVTQIENRYAVDWFLRISQIQDEQFGEGMIKIRNDCLENPN